MKSVINDYRTPSAIGDEVSGGGVAANDCVPLITDPCELARGVAHRVCVGGCEDG